MDKQRLCIERELMSNSAQIIWDLISTDSGLARWVADSVTQDGEQLTFVWGELWSHHEVRKALSLRRLRMNISKLVGTMRMDRTTSLS
ncbi:START-like domain-containing protein [Hoylesella shahii]|uniref:START-like domain-containing protein n=1 Tax=Hoylesella shahii TaxID=228603 RepID=UPI0021D2491A|nr:START-like domain-containing protein [Hoylesella shahii]